YLGGDGSPLDSASAELAMPEVGTVLRLITNKTITTEDVFNFTTPEQEIFGCTDPEAWNYNPDATIDDGSCEDYINGDLNSDNVLGILDIVTLVSIVIGDTEPDDYQLVAGDYNGDGILDILDIVQLVTCVLSSCWTTG
ncbi:MAG: hypothetical protein GXO91_00765, partial [FCB group bacterium]|nr:hypothetical protein [FCB group bacterium]